MKKQSPGSKTQAAKKPPSSAASSKATSPEKNVIGEQNEKPSVQQPDGIKAIATARTGFKKFLYSKPHEYPLLTMFFHLPFGAVFSTALWFLVFSRVIPITSPNPVIREVFQWIMISLFAIGYSTMPKFRCSCWVALPTLLGKNGFIFSQALILDAIMAGPIHNLKSNGEHVAESLVCNLRVAGEVSIERIKLRAKPLAAAASDITAGGFQMRKNFGIVEKLFGPLEHEIYDRKESSVQKKIEEALRRQIDKIRASQRGLQEPKRRPKVIEEEKKYEAEKSQLAAVKAQLARASTVAKLYAEKIESRCSSVYIGALQQCIQMFDTLYAKCIDWIDDRGAPWSWFRFPQFFCSMTRVSAFCSVIDMFSLRDAQCKSMEIANLTLDFADTLEVADKAISDLKANVQFKINYKLKQPPRPKWAKSLADIVGLLKLSFMDLTWLLKLLQVVVDGMLVMLVGLGFWNAHGYVKAYLTDIKFDNTYRTPYFDRLQRRRKEEFERQQQKCDNYKGPLKLHLEPLQKHEQKRLSGLFACKFSGSKLAVGILRLIGLAILVACIIFIDDLTVRLIGVIRTLMSASIDFYGFQALTFEILGSGFLAVMVKSVLRDVNVTYETAQNFTNSHCLVKISFRYDRTLMWIILGFIFCFLVIIGDAYVLRFRWWLCSLCYRKRQKRRILWLYNDMLHRRKTFVEYAKLKVPLRLKKLEFEKRNRSRMLLKIVGWFPRLNALRKYIQRELCIFCGNNFARKALRVCPKTEGRDEDEVKHWYCKFCWQMTCASQRCWVCIVEAETMDTLAAAELDEDQLDEELQPGVPKIELVDVVVKRLIQKQRTAYMPPAKE